MSKWISSLEGACEGSLDSFTKSELKLIILSARDREASLRNYHKEEIVTIQANMMTLSDNIVKFTNKVEENLSVMTENCSTLTAYMKSPSGKEDSSEQLRKFLKEKEANKKYACEEEKDKKSRENSLILYGMSEDVELVDCSKELL